MLSAREACILRRGCFPVAAVAVIDEKPNTKAGHSHGCLDNKLQRAEGHLQVCALQKSKSTRRRKAQDPQAEALPKLTEDEKADIVSQAVEALQDAIQQVRQHKDLIALQLLTFRHLPGTWACR